MATMDEDIMRPFLLDKIFLKVNHQTMTKMHSDCYIHFIQTAP